MDDAKLKIRYTKLDDVNYLTQWLKQPGMKKCFPMTTNEEVHDAAKRWISFSNIGCSLTAEYDKQPCGLVSLYLLPYLRLIHQCEWGLVVSREYQDMGVGNFLINEITSLAKDSFKLELLHVQVFEHNKRGRAFFEKHGYREFGRQTHWLKDKNNYSARIFMERFI
ncbi:MAG: GNAT family N-acetyltransferase [Chlamydiota bacterium]